MRKLNTNSFMCIFAFVAMVTLFGYQQLQPKQAIAQNDQDRLQYESVVFREAHRIRSQAGLNERCVALATGITPQEAKDKAIVQCHLKEKRERNRATIAREMLTFEALEVAENGE